ncbi:MAG TPA: type II toxin-antitoxin system RelE/ParE family toxin [Rhizomicrobium sp.]|jgi:proteic killer suppression protein|nr:type II toxin-antitoxin system RelE/ParE family toxin [Rhizomicrobium sp.]
MEIVGFRHKGLERFWRTNDSKGISSRWTEKLRAMLTAIEEANDVTEVGLLPGWKLHPLKGSKRGAWSMWITGNQRLTFLVDGDTVSELNIEDYHG